MTLPWRQSLTGRTLLQIALAVGLIILVATGVTYHLVLQAVEERGLLHLQQYGSERAKREEADFLLVATNLHIAKRAFLERFHQPDPPGYLDQWDKWFERCPDGAVRSRREYSDTYKYSTLWAHKDTVFTPELKRRVLIQFEICQRFIDGWVHGFRSLYAITPEQTNVGFDSLIPNWVYDAKADYAMNGEAYIAAAMPQVNPERALRWTGSILEPVSREYFVSAMLPVDLDGKYIAAFGHDIRVELLLEESTRANVVGLTHMIFGEDGRIVAHPGKKKQILDSNGLFYMQRSGDPVLEALYEAVNGRKERQFAGYDRRSGNYYAANRLAGPDWIYLTTLPRAILREQAFRSAQWVLWIGLGSLALVLLLLSGIFRNRIARPLHELLRVTQRMSAGEAGARVGIDGDDELGRLGGAFNQMARSVAERDEAVRSSERRWRLLFEQAPLSIIIFAPDGHMTRVNGAYEQLWGVKLEQVKAWNVLTDPQLEAAGLRPLILRAFAGEVVSLPPAAFDTGRVHPDGPADSSGVRWVSALLYPLVDARGRVEEIICIQEDVTERKRVEDQTRNLNQELERRVIERTSELSASEGRVRTMLENAPEAIVVLDAATGQFVDCNRNALRFFELELEQLLESSPVKLSPEFQPDGHSSLALARKKIEEARNGRSPVFEWMHRSQRGELIPCEIRLSRLPATGRELVIGTIIDVSERKRAEAELLKTIEHERELSQLKSDFVSTVSHEFRTPLEIIMSSGEILQRYHERLSSEQRQTHLQSIHESVRRMDQLMREVLLLSRAEAGRMPFVPVELELAPLCRRLVDEILSATNHTNPVHFTAGDGLPELARGDEGLLRHIFTNLLSNAVKYSPPGEPVEFAVTRENGAAIFTVKDRGCGIPAADQERVFQAFHRGRNVRQISGTGLGLVIVKRCVTLHGGSLRFESAEGAGTTFTVNLPLFTATAADGTVS